jgi:dihydropteroate synthase
VSGLRVLFVTGRLAEPSLRAVVAELAPRAGIEPLVAVLPISVASLMPTDWIARHLEIPLEGVDRIVLPGLCRGDLDPIRVKVGEAVSVERGPADLRDLPALFGQQAAAREGFGGYSIEILAEINHANRLDLAEILDVARRYAADGADLIDLGCDPGGPWVGVGEAVRALRDAGHRVSIDSFDPAEVAAAVSSGAELVLSVNGTNCEVAADWGRVEVVAMPDQPGSLDGLDATIEQLERLGVPYRIDPILEPIGFGFAASLGRYLEVRRRYPGVGMLMGVGNLTELTDADSAGINVVLAGFCEELKIGSVLTTEVINWARSSVRELDLARRLVHCAVTRRTLPKRLEPGLVMLRDDRLARYGPEALGELQARIKDLNWRIFAEDGRLHAINGQGWVSDEDPYVLFEQMGVTDPGHAFYLGYELAKAVTALTLSKGYRQDQALDWGFLTRPEVSHHDRKKRAGRKEEGA